MLDAPVEDEPLAPKLLLGAPDEPGVVPPTLLPVPVVGCTPPALPVLLVPGAPTPELPGAAVPDPVGLGSWVVPVVVPWSSTPGVVGLVAVDGDAGLVAPVPDGVVVP